MVGCVVLNFNDSKTTIELLNRMKNMKSIDVIVVVDNCSTDDSFSVLKQYTSKKIQVIQSEKKISIVIIFLLPIRMLFLKRM